MDAVIVRKLDLPFGVKGITVLDENDDFNIYINERYSLETQSEAFRHEVEHIKQGHFYRYADVMALEEQACQGRTNDPCTKIDGLEYERKVV